MIMKEIKGYPNYFVTDSGKIIGKKSRKSLKAYMEPDGYLTVHLYKDGDRKKVRVHRLVAMAFLQNPNKAVAIRHKDGDKTNNRAENLEWTKSSFRDLKRPEEPAAKYEGTLTDKGCELLVTAIYKQAALDYRTALLADNTNEAHRIEKFLKSGAYEVDPEIGAAIIRRVRQNTRLKRKTYKKLARL